MTFHRLISLAALAALLAACGDAPQEGEVSGEVLEGTISDQMLPLDQLRSEAPLADPTGTGRGSGPGAEANDAAEADGDAEAQEPQPEAPSEDDAD